MPLPVEVLRVEALFEAQQRAKRRSTHSEMLLRDLAARDSEDGYAVDEAAFRHRNPQWALSNSLKVWSPDSSTYSLRGTFCTEVRSHPGDRMPGTQHHGAGRVS